MGTSGIYDTYTPTDSQVDSPCHIHSSRVSYTSTTQTAPRLSFLDTLLVTVSETLSRCYRQDDKLQESKSVLKLRSFDKKGLLEDTGEKEVLIYCKKELVLTVF